MMIVSALMAVALGGEIEVSSTVRDVTVYRDRARVTRVATIDVPVGRSDLVFEGLPSSLISSSLSADGRGTAGATLTGIDMRPRAGTRDTSEERQALLDQVVVLEDAKRMHQDAVTRVKREVEFLNSLSPSAPATLDRATFLADDAPEQLAALATQIGTDRRALVAEQRKHERAIRDLEPELTRLRGEIAQLMRPQGTDTVRVAVGLDAARAGRVTVELDYVVTGASWTPKYDVRYELKTESVRVDLSGHVRQNTGESWDGVRLTLSTATPNASTTPPVLTPFNLQTSRGRVDSRPTAIDKVTAFEFTAGDRETVRPDNTMRRVGLTSVSMKGDVVHKVVARSSESAWLTARVENTADFTLLPGPMSAYLGTAYIGDGQLQLTPPGEEVDLSFGVDDRVKVERIPLQNQEDEASGLASRDKKRYGWTTKITNGTGRPLVLEVHDQVPVSREASYEVKTKTEPEVEIPKGTGLFTWKADVPAGGEAEFLLEYEVSWPEGARPRLLD